MITKKTILLPVILLILVISNTLSAQILNVSDNVKGEITKVLELWNNDAKNSDLEGFMSLFDGSENIMLIGSDSGEVFKGRDQIKGWLTQLFEIASFSWEMDRIYIDSNDNTAWVFVEGRMVVAFKTGKTKKTPYRFTGIMVRKGSDWKWRLFNGSNPRGE
jgi:ketosteroid isomerase-like protein